MVWPSIKVYVYPTIRLNPFIDSPRQRQYERNPMPSFRPASVINGRAVGVRTLRLRNSLLKHYWRRMFLTNPAKFPHSWPFPRGLHVTARYVVVSLLRQKVESSLKRPILRAPGTAHSNARGSKHYVADDHKLPDLICCLPTAHTGGATCPRSLMKRWQLITTSTKPSPSKKLGHVLFPAQYVPSQPFS